MREIGVGLLGFGTVGAGVVETLLQNGDLLADRLGCRLVLRRIADLDLERDRGVAVDRALLTKDAASVIDDPAVDVVIELVGGVNAARTFITRSLSAGKPVVTANKALLAEHGAELMDLAQSKKTDLYFEAGVGGGIPIIKALREGLIANRILSVYGILNGTCNYILTRMEREHLRFERVLKDAQAAGYAETDPGLDIDGHDTAHKAAILASLAHGMCVPLRAVTVEGIRGLAEMDIEYALDLGYRIKLLAVIKHVEGQVEVRVHPTLIPIGHMLASVSGVFNAILVEGDVVGQTVFYGQGAGRRPTASAVIADLADVARNIVAGSPGRIPPLAYRAAAPVFRDAGTIITRSYLRVSVLDKPGVLGHIASILGQNGISIASVLQKEEHQGRHVPVIIVTHRASERQFQAALAGINALPAVGAPVARMRIEDLGMEKKT